MRDATGYDEWYTNMAVSPTRDEIVQRALGLPPELRSSSLLGWDGIAEVVAALDVGGDDVLLDLACGRGGYGLEVARRTGARLIGVDFSAVAIEQARERAGERAEFRVGELAATGLGDGEVDAVMCVDAVQFADSIVAALKEMHRVLVAGGRVALTCWEAVDRTDTALPQRFRDLDLGNQLVEAGFVEVTVEDRPDWHEAERAMWLAATQTEVGDDLALRDLRDEGERVLSWFDAKRRVLATAKRP